MQFESLYLFDKGLFDTLFVGYSDLFANKYLVKRALALYNPKRTGLPSTNKGNRKYDVITAMVRQETETEPRSAETPLDDVPRRLYTVAETARALAISRSKVYDLIHGGRLTSVKIDGARRVRGTAIDEYIERLEGDVDQ